MSLKKILTEEQKEKYKKTKSLWLEKNKNKIKEYSTKLRKEKKLKSLKYKGNKCNHCDLEANEDNSIVFDFHHIDESNKIENPSKTMLSNWETIKKELDKCILLCSNCHRLEHNRLRNEEKNNKLNINNI